MFGGETADSAVRDVWVLKRTDQASGAVDHSYAWTQVSPSPDPIEGVPAARSLHSTTFVPSSGLVLIYGGRSNSGSPLSDIWALSVVPSGGSYSGQWTKLTDSGAGPAPRFGHSAVYYALVHKLIVFGGSLGGAYSDSLWALDLNALTWAGSRPSVSPKARFRHAAVLLGNELDSQRTLVIAGGADGDSCMASTWSTPVSAGVYAWTQRPYLPTPRRGLTLTLDPLGPALALGGESFAGTALNDVDVIYLPSFAGWYPNAQLSRIAPRAGHSATYHSTYVQARFPTVYTPPGAGPATWSDVTTAARILPTYPFMFVAPNGKVFMAGPGTDTKYLNLGSGLWESEITASYGAGTAAMYAPGKILRAAHHSGQGASDHAEFIDLTVSSPSWTHTHGMVARSEANSTVLPTGEVLVTGGWVSGFAGERRPQRWKPGVGWGPPLAPDPVVRGYHSTAVLLPDGRVLSAGGSYPDDLVKRTVSIYSPPYLFQSDGSPATRPTVSSGPASIAYGQVLTFCTSTSSISAVSLMRPSAVTHGFNQEQRLVPLSFVTAASPTRVLVTAPASSNLAPPGDYMLFIVGQDSVPAIARWIRLSSASGLDSCDTTPPSQVTTLGSSTYCTRMELSWTAPADDGSISASGSAKEYDLRWFPRASITNPDTFAIASHLSTSPPQAPGSAESYVDQTGACSGRRYYAIRTLDDSQAPNVAAISNLADAGSTPCPPPECDDGGFLVKPPPAELAVHGPFPNPATREIALRLAFPTSYEGQRYELTLYDLSGRLVGTLDGGVASSGTQPVKTFGLGKWGELSPGLYVVRLGVGESEIRRKVVLLK